MRKTLLNGLIAAAFAVAGSAQAAPLMFSLDGTGGNVITATALDWSQTSFLALGGNQAISNKVTNDFCAVSLSCGPGFTPLATTFDVLTHAKLTGYNNAAGVTVAGLPAGFGGEITITARFTENVVFADPATSFASFRTTGPGWVEMYYSAAQNSANVSGSGFNDGTLIMRGDGVTGRTLPFSSGNFTNDGTTGDLDVSGNGNDYIGQKTVNGGGTQFEIKFGSGGFALNSNFLLTSIADFSLFFNNISIGLPYGQVDPSDCFNTSQGAATNAAINAGTATGLVSQCDAPHINGLMSANSVSTGYVPVIGVTNGAFGVAPDFMAQTDFNSSVTGSVPEPGMLALLGLAFAGLGLTTARRRKV